MEENRSDYDLFAPSAMADPAEADLEEAVAAKRQFDRIMAGDPEAERNLARLAAAARRGEQPVEVEEPPKPKRRWLKFPPLA
jgi:hypothetical protein